MSTFNTLSPGMWRILGYVLLAQTGLSIFQELGWQQLNHEAFVYNLDHSDGLANQLVTIAGMASGIWLSQHLNGFRQAIIVGFGLEFAGLLVLFALGNFQLAWLLSFLVFYAGFSLIVLQSWIRYNIYFPWATQAKLLAFMLLGTVIPIGVALATLFPGAIFLLVSGVEDYRAITYLAGLVITIAGVGMGLKDAYNEFFVPAFEELEGESQFWQLPLILLLIGFITWLGYTAIDTPYSSSSYFPSDLLLSLVPLLSYLVPIVLAIWLYRAYLRSDTTSAQPFLWLWVALSAQMVILLFNWFAPGLPILANTLVDYLHQTFMLIIIQPILVLLIFHRLPFRAHWWFGGLLIMAVFAPMIADWLFEFKGPLFIALLLTFGPLIIGIRENQAILRERFQLDEAAFELEDPSDDPLDNLTDHLIDNSR